MCSVDAMSTKAKNKKKCVQVKLRFRRLHNAAENEIR